MNKQPPEYMSAFRLLPAEENRLCSTNEVINAWTLTDQGSSSQPSGLQLDLLWRLEPKLEMAADVAFHIEILHAWEG
jgi:hypothetical protein